MSYNGRDVEVVKLDSEKCMVMACDSAGAIGEKELDVIKAPPYLVGRLTARVALLEIISVGAVPEMLSVTISNEPLPTGNEMMLGVKEELQHLKLDHVLEHIAVSTEKNFETMQTGVGITVIGVCRIDALRVSNSQNEDFVYVAGLPKVGNEVLGSDDTEIINGRHIMRLLEHDFVHDIIPIGSMGIRKEIEQMCGNSNLRFIADRHVEIDMDKSAGPSTCAVVTIPKDMKMPKLANLQITKVGRLEKR